MVILNEKLYAERVIESCEVGRNPSQTLFLLGKYYAQCCNFNKPKIIEVLSDFMAKNYKDYRSAQWEELIEDCAKKCSKKVNGEYKYPLREFDNISISKSELEQIGNAGSMKFSKLLFVMLCYAKYYNLCSKTNNGWINTSIKDVYRSARVTVKHKTDKFLYLNSLMQMGYISFSNKNLNLNIKVNYIDDGEPELLISDFRELSYEYLKYLGKAEFINCQDCGVLMKRTGRRLIRCCECAYKSKLRQNQQYYNDLTKIHESMNPPKHKENL